MMMQGGISDGKEIEKQIAKTEGACEIQKEFHT
jgi:hypothetical protein